MAPDMRLQLFMSLFVVLASAVAACGAEGQGGTRVVSPPPPNPPPPNPPPPNPPPPNPPPPNPPPPTSRPVDERTYSVLSTRSLDSDGPQAGLPAYDLIRAFGGPRPIEAPDLYPVNHPEVAHIYEDTDAQVGHHFVFIIHRDTDIDRDRTENTDRQRNEIKTYGGSEAALKGFENETFVIKWKFRINARMEVSRRFTHFFQLKAVGGDDSQPILTISGAERSGDDGIEVRHSPLRDTTILQRENWSLVLGEWLEAYCRATFSDEGALRLIVTRLRDGKAIFDIELENLDLWRGEAPDHFVRPKWGIYRSILDLANLRPDEEAVQFANFSVSKVTLE